MRRPRSRAGLVLGLAVPFSLLGILVLLLSVGSRQAQASLPASPPGSPKAPWDYPVCFTGQDHVDLKWSTDPLHDTYIVMRDGTEIKRFNATSTFYRDRSVTKGQTYIYLICAQHGADQPLCGLSSTTTVGQIHGTLYESVYWPGDDYQLAGHVDLGPLVTLYIGPGATVAGPPATTEINDQNQGYIQVDGATIQAKLYLRSDRSWVDGSTIGGEAFGAVVLSQWDGTEFTGNTFTSTSILQISGSAWQDLYVTGNRFYASQVWAGGNVDLYISGNRFEKGSEVLLEDPVMGGVEDNTFYDSHIRVTSNNYLEIKGNRMHLLDPNTAGSTVLIGVSCLNPNVRIYSNLLDGYLDGYYGTGSGVSVAAWEGGHGDAEIYWNIVTELERAIYAQGPVDALIDDNTITHNQTGIYVKGEYPRVAAGGNCIGGNAPYGGSADWGGLTTFARTQAVNATGNYWGHPSGPTHPDNPGGQGDRIRELDASWNVITGVVNYAGWLPGHHCNEIDLSVAGLEVVQSIQDLNNSVPLVARKPTVVRIYADSGMAPQVAGVPVEMKAYRNGSLLGSKQGTVTALPITDWDPVRAGEEGGLGIRLDSDWLSGTVTVTVELNAQHTISESTFSNNQVTYTLSFTERKPLHIGLLPIEYRPNEGVEPRVVPTAELPSLVQFLHKVYPLSEVRVTLLNPLWWPFDMQGGGSWNQAIRAKQLLNELTWYRTISNRSAGGPGQMIDQIVGVFPGACDDASDLPYNSVSEPRWLGGEGAASFMCSGSGEVLSTAVGKNLGLYTPCDEAHKAACCGGFHSSSPGLPRQDWPYANPSIQEYGFDTIEGTIVLRVTPDMATWCHPKWLSPHNYKKLFEANGEPPVPHNGNPGGNLVQAAAGQYLLTGGLVYTDGVVSFDPFWQLTADEPPLGPPEGTTYRLEVQDAAHTVLYSHTFDLAFFDYEGGVPTGVDGYLTALPLDAAASRVVLKRGVTELGEVVASTHAPQVTVLAPKSSGLEPEHMTISWTASDDDGDELAFILSYSNDGGATWLPFALNLTGTNSLDLDLSNLPGGLACQVQVQVSDGWHNAADLSESFAVADKVPLAGILRPADGALVAAPLTLQGFGYDLEEGQLQGAALQWSSDVDGPLGSGDTLWDVDLSPGQHTLTLQATDSQGHTGTASVVITVQGGGPILKQIYLPYVLRRY